MIEVLEKLSKLFLDLEGFIETLKEYPTSTLVRWHCILNSWGWPEEMPYKESALFQYLNSSEDSRRIRLIKAIGKLTSGEDRKTVWNNEGYTAINLANLKLLDRGIDID